MAVRTSGLGRGQFREKYPDICIEARRDTTRHLMTADVHGEIRTHQLRYNAQADLPIAEVRETRTNEHQLRYGGKVPFLLIIVT